LPLIDGGDFFPANCNERFAREGVGDFGGEGDAVDGESMPGRNGAGAGKLEQQRSGAAHFLFEQPGRSVHAVGLQRVGADQFGEVGGLMGGRGARGAHLTEFDGDAAAGALPGGFRSGKAGTDDADAGHGGATSRAGRSQVASSNIIWRSRGPSCRRRLRMPSMLGRPSGARGRSCGWERL
jgi:hypothetical protein